MDRRVLFRCSLAICATIGLLAPPLCRMRTSRAFDVQVPNISKALSCGREGATTPVFAGEDLFRVDIDTKLFPNAVCNDGTPATMFVRRFSKKAKKNNWVIFLLGGGDCASPVECVERWCSLNTNYGADQMSTRYLTGQSIRGAGAFTPDPAINNFAGWNQVFIYYCSSDDWRGSASDIHLSANDGSGHQVDYSINFRGADIVEAVIATLQRKPNGDVVIYRDSNREELVMPDLDKAQTVLFSGSSAGGNGVKYYVDRVGELIRATNKNCKRADNCSLVYLGLIDANFPASYKATGLSQADFYTGPPGFCSYDDLYISRWNNLDTAILSARGDESCIDWHKRNTPGTEWQCGDPQHLVFNHLTTPLFIRFDLQDDTSEPSS